LALPPAERLIIELWGYWQTKDEGHIAFVFQYHF
jgi:hypothetical protein